MTSQCYCVTYPHPDIPAKEIVQLCEITLPTTKPKLLKAIIELFPALHSSDLKDRETTAVELPYTEEDDFREEVYQWINEKESKGTEVKSVHTLEKLFPDGPKEPLGEWVHVVVVTLEILEYLDCRGDQNGNIIRMKDRRKFCRYLGGGLSPSDCNKSASVIATTITGIGGPRIGRPSHRFGPPTALFDKDLARLRYDLDHLDKYTPSSATVRSALNLVTTATGFFRDEAAREEALQDTLKGLLGAGIKLQVEIGGGKKARPDGVWFKGSFACLIFELKNELGLGGDPLLQSLVGYGRLFNQQEYLPFISQSTLPVVILTMTGNCLAISTALYTTAIYVDKLLSIDLHLGVHGSENVVRLARIFMAVRGCVERLGVRYGELEAAERHKINPDVMYPNPTADPPDAEIPQLRFFAKVDRMKGTALDTIDQGYNESHGIYLAEEDSRIVLVKFTPTYNEEAHRLLARHSLAPALHHCARVIGGMYMVVMDYIADARPLPFSFPPPDVSLPPDASPIREALTKALGLLHNDGLVFGDLRESNILYSSEGNRVYLVDFDWAGRNGVDRYSACANSEAGVGIKNWEILVKEYDLANLKRIMLWLGEKESAKSGE